MTGLFGKRVLVVCSGAAGFKCQWISKSSAFKFKLLWLNGHTLAAHAARRPIVVVVIIIIMSGHRIAQTPSRIEKRWEDRNFDPNQMHWLSGFEMKGLVS